MTSHSEPLFHISPNAIARCRTVRPVGSGMPEIYFDEVNQSFCRLTGSTTSTILKTPARQLLPGLCTELSQLPGWQEPKLSSECDRDFERLLPELGRWVRISIRVLDTDRFALFLEDISHQHTAAELMEDYFQTRTSELDYPEIAERFRRLTGAQAAAFHLHCDSEYPSTTVAVAADPDLQEGLATLIGTPMLRNQVQLERLLRLFGDHEIIEVASLAGHLSSRHPYRPLLQRLEEKTLTGQKLIALIRSGERYVGHFTLVMPPGQHFSSHSMAGIFIREVGLLATRVPQDESDDNTLRELVTFSNQVPGGIYRFQQHPDGSFSVPFATSQLAELFGLPTADREITADELIDRVIPADRDPMLEAIQESAAGMSDWDHDFRVQHPQKGERWLHGLAHPTRKLDGSIVWSGYLTDITDRKSYEEALRQAKQAADEASRAKDYLIANVSHEVRTPLNGIMGMNQLMLETELSPDQQEYLLLTQQSIQRLTAVVDDLLDFSRITNGAVALHKRSYNPGETLRSLAEPYRLLARQKGVELDLQINPRLPEQVLGDADRVGQIVGNLLNNAVKFTDQGRIQLTASCTPGEEGSDTLVIEVRDTGIGFDSDTAERLFQPFRQGDGSLTRRFAGTGLGLAIVQELVDLMRGSVGAESSPGKGARFTVRLPLQDADGTDGECEASSPAVDRHSLTPDEVGTPKPAILIAEDDMINQRVIAHLVERLGYRTEMAATGQEAIDLLSAGEFALVLMDVQMPVLDGTDAARMIRTGAAGEHNRGIPIIAVTAHVQPEEQERFLAAGMDAIQTKPLNAEALSQQIAELLASR
ncbi:ATP-binding protein [Spirochaeta africana]|uniref:histidine kinase n=1 Tax=Spirochaeta africana (strain ATCC 700263 / DSM 8902 / Z-7692) TaxID=889378 RepID=H9UFH2_SPIAZ|nr:ATP-binding protein [Spirochaeta africana]AFG36265.1 signal transduction histidine kinase [Spirochaeta africana DSM 8902]